MLLNSDFKELLRLFEKHRVRYLIVGGYAVMKYSEPRFTKDTDCESFYQMGTPPIRVDIMMSIPGGNFEKAWLNKEVVEIDSTKLLFISKLDLIKTKKASGRPQDLIDLGKLHETDSIISPL